RVTRHNPVRKGAACAGICSNPKLEVGSLAVDPGLPLDGGLAIVAALVAIPLGFLGSSKYTRRKEQPEGIRRRIVQSVSPESLTIQWLRATCGDLPKPAEALTGAAWAGTP